MKLKCWRNAISGLLWIIDVPLDWGFCIFCMIHRMSCQRWATLKLKTQQPCPRTTYPWVRWTRPQCSPSSEKRCVTGVRAGSFEPAEDLTFFFWCSCLQTRSSPKRLRSTNGRGSTRRPERRFLRWGLICSALSTCITLSTLLGNCRNVQTLSMFPNCWNGAFCHPHRKIVAEYEKTVAQMIGELVPPSGHRVGDCIDLRFANFEQIHIYI